MELFSANVGQLMKQNFALNLVFRLFLGLILVLPNIAHSVTRPSGQPLPPLHTLPAIRYKVQPVHHFTGTLFAYSSTVGQTDANPFVTASGATVTDGIVANNCLPFGTKVKFPKLFGNKTFIVEDRMAPRYGCATFDVWHATTTAAKQFGRKTAVVEVY